MNTTAQPEDYELVKDRYEFVGNFAPEEIRAKYKGKMVNGLFKAGNRSPFLYCFND